MTVRKRAFVLSGGGARGALQVGALNALLEAGIVPDLLVGTSVGAINAAHLAVHGYDRHGMMALEDAWRDAAGGALLPTNYWFTALRSFLVKGETGAYRQLREFLLTHGLSPDMRFGDLPGIPFVSVAADLNKGQPVISGRRPEESVLEAVMASAALPPWVQPRRSGSRYLVDGGTICNVPVQPALAMGATELIVLDLTNAGDAAPGFGSYVPKLINAMQRRTAELELSLAEARGVPVRTIRLRASPPVPMWRFSAAPGLIESGYTQAKVEIALWPETVRRWWQVPQWVEDWRDARWLAASRPVARLREVRRMLPGTGSHSEALRS